MPSFVILVVLCLSVTLEARDFGTYGHTYPIQEQNILEYLHERLLSTTNEELELFSKKQIERIREPKALNLPYATSYRSFFYDPSITVKDDIKDHEGNIIVKRGTKHNPLDNCKLNNDLLFFDGTQESNILWANSIKGIWILIKGKPIDLEEQERRSVYFDQFGYLTSKFGIKKIPAKVSQDGKLLKIEEFPLEVSK